MTGYLQGCCLPELVDAPHEVGPPKTWREYVREGLLHLSELHGVFGAYSNWWVGCKIGKRGQ
jgi:hypothetical protein